MVFLESPTNPMMHVSDIKTIAKLTHARGALLAVDNTIMSPVLSKPLDHGADLVIHSATKFLSGHGDTIGGIVTVRDEDIAESIAFTQNAEGNGLSPFDSFMILRGMRTMSLRMRKAQDSTREIASFLCRHPAVSKVNYLDDTNKLHFSQCEGAGAVLSFETKDVELSRFFVEHATNAKTGLFRHTVSFGSVRSYHLFFVCVCVCVCVAHETH
jgi:cystathionine beta-lyase